MKQYFSLTAAEKRLINLKISDNFKQLAKDTGSTYISEPIRNGNAAQTALGVPAGSLRAVLEAPDALWEGLLDRELDFGTQNRIIRDVGTIGRDTANTVGNLLTLHPIKALKSAGGVGLAILRMPQSTIMEIIDQGGGFDSHRQGMRTQYQRVMDSSNN